MNDTNTKKNLTIRLELIWWLFTAVVVAGVLYPILKSFSNYPYLLINSLFVIIFITFTRHVFLLEHTFLAYRQVLKAAIVLMITPIIFLLISEVTNFQTFLDENRFEPFMEAIPYEEKLNLLSYIETEMLFFGIGSVIIAIILPFRLIVSVWRNRNKGTV